MLKLMSEIDMPISINQGWMLVPFYCCALRVAWYLPLNIAAFWRSIATA